MKRKDKGGIEPGQEELSIFFREFLTLHGEPDGLALLGKFRQDRGKLLQCLYAVAAADGSISTIETSELTAIANELGFTRPEANALRSQYRDKLAVLQVET